MGAGLAIQQFLAASAAACTTSGYAIQKIVLFFRGLSCDYRLGVEEARISLRDCNGLLPK